MDLAIDSTFYEFNLTFTYKDKFYNDFLFVVLKINRIENRSKTPTIKLL